ncbi:MAG: hypothetical protein KAS48_01455, partial [Gammaproteobacteria bacterium]|nr:hypothetical protein [Gammaproteobacteria bacterium]
RPLDEGDSVDCSSGHLSLRRPLDTAKRAIYDTSLFLSSWSSEHLREFDTRLFGERALILCIF